MAGDFSVDVGHTAVTYFHSIFVKDFVQFMVFVEFTAY
jgi:hypothetical protein